MQVKYLVLPSLVKGERGLVLSTFEGTELRYIFGPVEL